MKPPFFPLALLVGTVSLPGPAAFSSGERRKPLIPGNQIELIQTADCLVVGLRDFDLLLQRFEGLNGKFEFQTPDGQTLDSYGFDYRAPVSRSHLAFLKRSNRRYGRVAVVLQDGDQKLLKETLPLPPPIEPSMAAALTEEKAFLVRGSQGLGPGGPPEIILPDLNSAREEREAEPGRTVDLQESLRWVRADRNIPQIGSNNNSIVSRQTAHPQDPTRKSLYISLKTPLFDPETGEYDSNLRFLAEIPLEETWIQGDEDSTVWVSPKKLRVHIPDELNWMMAVGNRLCLLSYHYNYFWVMEVGEDGRTRRLVRLKTLEGQPLTHFGFPRWVFAGPECRGLQIPVTIEGEAEEKQAFLASDSWHLSAAVPAPSRTEPFHFNHPGPIRGEKTYGRTEFSKSNLAGLLGQHQKGGKGKLTLYYDVMERLKAHPGGFKKLIDRMNGPSLGPAYYLASLPGKEMKVLGNAEYISYYHALFDCSGEPGDPVHKEFLKLDTGEIRTNLGVEAGLGPYCHTWIRNEAGEDVLYYAGYTGICRMTYRKNGQVLPRFRVDNLTPQLRPQELDGAPHGSIKWFRDMAPGLGDQILVTGVNQANRGGNAYSGGLMYFHRQAPHHLYKLSRMSASHKTKRIAWRVVMKPGSKAEQEIFLGGNYSAEDALTMEEPERPANTQPKVFVYRNPGEGRWHDLFGFSLIPDGQDGPGVEDLAISRNQLYLLILYKDGTLASFDPIHFRFVDTVQTNPRYVHLQGGQVLYPMPTGHHAALAFDEEQKTSATFRRISVGATGRITVEPFLKCTSKNPDLFPSSRGRASAFLYDHRNNDGSYDFVWGPDPARRGTWILIIRDFIPPRGPRESVDKP